MNIKSGKVLLTGGGGFIGSHLADLLIKEGADLRVFFKYNGRHDTGLIQPATLASVESVFGDITDYDAVEKAVNGCNVVFHLAASISIPYSYERPQEVFDANATGTMNVLQACRKHEVERVVVTSTSEVYGSADIIPITENNPLKPQSPYAASKCAADAMARSFYCSYGLPVVIGRPYNAMGPRQSDRAIIPNVIKHALWSDRIKVGTLVTKRDFVFVEDLALAFLACGEGDGSLNGETIQFATNQSWSVQEVIDIVQEILGVKVPVETSMVRMRPQMSEVLHLQGDYSKAQRLLGWKPSISFRDGLCRTIEYIRSHKDDYPVDRYGI